MSSEDKNNGLDVLLKLLSALPSVAAVAEGWLVKAIPMTGELRPRAAFLSTVLAVFGLGCVWLRNGAGTFKPAFKWFVGGVLSFFIYLTLWDQFRVPPTNPIADQVLRHAFVACYAAIFLALSVAFAILIKSYQLAKKAASLAKKAKPAEGEKLGSPK